MCSIFIFNSYQSQELPRWLVDQILPTKEMEKLREKLARTEAKILCDVVNCPNLPECYSKKIAAFQILGNTCSRKCRFCSVPDGLPLKVDEMEVKRIAQSIKELGLKKIVLTSAPRDDLVFGGAGFFSRAIKFLKEEMGVEIEACVPDFRGSKEALQKVIDVKPDVITHSLETVKKLFPVVCPKADYNRSLELLAGVKEMDASTTIKSGLMLGLGETDDDILKAMEDLRNVGCDLLTIGQYMSPSESHFPVHGYVLPKQFKDWEAVGRGMGFKGIASAPLVRSSYHVDIKNSCQVKG